MGLPGVGFGRGCQRRGTQLRFEGASMQRNSKKKRSGDCGSVGHSHPSPCLWEESPHLFPTPQA